MNDFSLLGALVTAPSRAFAELRERPKFWFPLLLVTLTTAALIFWYYSVVDIDWLKDAMYSNNPQFQKMPDADRARAMGMISRTMMKWGSTVGVIIMVPVLVTVQALYLFVAGKVTKLTPDFKHWFSFAAWTGLPALINTIVAAIFLLISDTTQMGPNVLQPLSLNELVFHLPQGTVAAGLLGALNLTYLLNWALMIIGVRAWSQRSWQFSSIYVLLPWVVIFGLWAVAAFR
jgi:hypothetical protein